MDTLTIGLPVFVLLALLAYGTSGRLAAASALLRLDAVTSAGALETVRRIEEGHADPYEQLAMEMGRLFRARSSVLPLTDAAALRSYAATTDGGYLRVPIVGDSRTHGLLQLWRTRDFTPTEVRLLQVLIGSIDRTVPTSTLLERVWSDADGADPSYVWVSVRRLRRKMETDPDRPRYLLTERGVGYRLASSAVASPVASSSA